MGLFENMLKDTETLFKNEVALSFDFHPKPLMYRDVEQRQMANCIKPLFQNRDGYSLLIHGRPGIGKTIAVKQVLQELNEAETSEAEIIPLYINCWQKNTTYKIVIDICEQIDYTFTQNKKTEELLKIAIARLNKSSVVFVFDEIDKAEDYDFLYTFLEQIYRKSILLISNYKEWLIQLDPRIKSRLNPQLLDFRTYNQQETKGILEQRKEHAFYNVWDNDAFNIIVEKTFQLKDIRAGLHLMNISGHFAENEASRKISKKHVELAIEKLDELSVKDLGLEEDKQFILSIIKLNTGKKIGDLFKSYQENGGKMSYKTFKRRIEDLERGKFVSIKTVTGGDEGSTSIVTYLSANGNTKSADSTKKLTDF
ncbi:AAA family ATPase [Candidatus Woesearchaeota archaeon]|nr:AAA family ATPase [Candidatus Woesearchaeota archaeon]